MLASGRTCARLLALRRACSARDERSPPKLSVAPMLDVTDCHFRFLLRLIAPNPRRTTLYTEMRVPQAVIHQARNIYRFMGHATPGTIPQLGGCDPLLMKSACQVLWDHGYIDSHLGININAGCPAASASDNVYGVILMRNPHLVAQIAVEMRKVLPSYVPISVKCRIGVDNEDSLEFLDRFISIIVEQSDVRWFTIHVRKAWLNGLSPKQNRKIPPLMYERAWELKRRWPMLHIEVNGGIENADIIRIQLAAGMDSIMLGRKVSADPFFLRNAEAVLYNDTQPIIDDAERTRILFSYAAYADYIQSVSPLPFKYPSLVRPLFHIFQSSDGRFLRDRLTHSLKEMISNTRDDHCLLLSKSTIRQSDLNHLLLHRQNLDHIEDGIVYQLTKRSYDAMLLERERRQGIWNVAVKKSR